MLIFSRQLAIAWLACIAVLIKWRSRPRGRPPRVIYLASASALISGYLRAVIHGEGHRGHAAAARSSLSAPRMTILSASPGSGRCSALASSHSARNQTSRTQVAQKEKPPEGGFQSNPMILDQAAINAGFDFRR
jgi:hypothetical protein